MSKTTKYKMRKFRKKMRRVIDLHCAACGFDTEVQKALEAEAELEVWLEDEIEKLVNVVEGNIMPEDRGQA
jgi:hypothetical protein